MKCQVLTTLIPPSRDLELQNVEIIVADISTFDMEASYDRIFSIEMFEVLNLTPSKLVLTGIMTFVRVSGTAYEKLSGSSSEDIQVDETRQSSVCTSFLP